MYTVNWLSFVAEVDTKRALFKLLRQLERRGVETAHVCIDNDIRGSLLVSTYTDLEGPPLDVIEAVKNPFRNHP